MSAGVPRRVWAGLVIGGLGMHTVVGLARPMASYRALELAVSPALLGAVAASYALLPLLVALPAGRSADAVGGAPVAAAGIVVQSLAAWGLALTSGLPGLLAAMAVLGLGHLLALVGMQAVIAQHAGGTALDRHYGWFSMLASIGQLAGPALAGGLAGQGGPGGTTRALVGGAVVAGATLLAVPLLLGPARRAAGAARPGAGPSSVGQILRSPGVPAAMVTSLAVLAALDIITVYLPALGESRGWSPQAVGILLSVRAAGSVASRLVLGRLVARLGRQQLLGASLAVSSLAVVGLALSGDLALAGVCIVVAGLSLGVGQPLTMAVVAARSPRGAQATALSVRLMGNRLGQVVIPAAAGAVAAATATTGVLVTAGLVVAGSALCLLPRRDRPT